MNKTLAVFARPIPYHKVLRKISGSVASAILLQQIEYWFSKYPNGFFKFLRPCGKPGYKSGDSWAEELGYSPKEFRTAFKHIGTTYKSKGEYDQAKDEGDRFNGKFYCSYHNRLTGQTWYYRNHEVVDRAIESLVEGASGVSDQREFTVSDQREHLPPPVSDQREFTQVTDRSFLLNTETTTETTYSTETTLHLGKGENSEIPNPKSEPEPIQSAPVNFESQSVIDQSISKTSGEDQFSAPVTIGSVTYKLSPELIDLEELWEFDSQRGRMEARTLAPGHRYPALVAHGLGDVWHGPGRNDFNPDVVSAIQEHLRKCDKPASPGNACSWITSRVNKGDWAPIELKRDEAIAPIAKPQGESRITQINAELRRLNRTCELPDNWFHDTGCNMVSELSPAQQQAYLIELKNTEVAHAA